MLELGSSAFIARREPRYTGALSTRNSYGRIVQAARSRLLANPGGCFTVQDIADATGLSRRAVYNHFACPEALYQAALHELVSELGERIGVDLPREFPPARAIHDFVRFAADLLSCEINLTVWRAIIRDGAAQPWLAGTYVRLVREPLTRTVELYLLRRRIGRDDPQRAAEQLIGMIEAASVTPRLLRSDSGPVSEAEVGFIVSSFLVAHFPDDSAVPALAVVAGPFTPAARG